MPTAQEQIDEIWELFRETDRRFKETDRKMAETNRKMAETDQKLDKTLQAIGELGNRLGEFVEHAIEPALVRLFQQRGIDVHEVHRDMSGKREGLATQVDLLVVDNEECVVVEAKSKLDVDDVDRHIHRMDIFKTVFPRYDDVQAMGAVAGMVIPEDVAKYAYRQGFYVIAPSGDDVVVMNDDDFTPKAW